MRVVVDTNVLVSGLLTACSPPAWVVEAIVADLARPIVCDEIITEYRAVLARPRLRIGHERAAELVELIERTAEWVRIPPYCGAPPLPDEGDWPFIAAARVGHAPLITGNLRHFPAELGVQTMTARRWAEAGPWAGSEPQARRRSHGLTR